MIALVQPQVWEVIYWDWMEVQIWVQTEGIITRKGTLSDLSSGSQAQMRLNVMS
jgi:hypothetical protein